MTQDVLKQYKEQNIMLSSPVKLVSMLYNEAVQQLNIAIQSIEEGAIEARWRANTKCMEIIYHMLITLDQERGGDIAAQLEQLFTYILKRLPEVDAKNNAQAAKDVLNLLTPLAESWQILAERDQAELDQEVAKAIQSQVAQSQAAESQDSQSQDSQSQDVQTPDIQLQTVQSPAVQSETVQSQNPYTQNGSPPPLAPPLDEGDEEKPKPAHRVVLSA